ncbi:MAG: hypothetical protein KDB88_12285 [Flavobacteriales bacterium]|nr:hypothetical protein [Flavobacteriales bacterium]
MAKSSLFHALFIGFLVGIVIYSVVKDTVGLVTLVPLFLIYRMFGKHKDEED